MRRSPAVLVSLVAMVVGSLSGCGQDAAGAGPVPPASPSSTASASETPVYPTLPAIVVRGEGEMLPPTDGQREWLEQITTHGIPEATIEDVQRQDVLIPAFEGLRTMPGWAWSDVGADEGEGGSIGFAGRAPQEALDVLRALPVDVRVAQGVLLTEDQRNAAQDAVCDLVFGELDVESGVCGTDQETLRITIDYSGQAEPDPADLQARALAAARAAVQDPVAQDVMDVVITYRDEPVSGNDVGPA